mgnify:CR=1 FL=1
MCHKPGTGREEGGWVVEVTSDDTGLVTLAHVARLAPGAHRREMACHRTIMSVLDR